MHTLLGSDLSLHRGWGNWFVPPEDHVRRDMKCGIWWQAAVRRCYNPRPNASIIMARDDAAFTDERAPGFNIPSHRVLFMICIKECQIKFPETPPGLCCRSAVVHCELCPCTKPRCECQTCFAKFGASFDGISVNSHVQINPQPIQLWMRRKQPSRAFRPVDPNFHHLRR